MMPESFQEQVRRLKEICEDDRAALRAVLGVVEKPSQAAAMRCIEIINSYKPSPTLTHNENHAALSTLIKVELDIEDEFGLTTK